MIVETPSCIVCKRTAMLEVDQLGYRLWSQHGKLIQDALPTLTDDERELLLSGTHAHCWARMWPEED